MLMNYSDQYKSPKWQKKRLEMLELTDYTCEECGAKDKQLHIHHEKYEKDKKVWEYDNEDLYVICDECHNTRHYLFYVIEYKLKSYSNNGLKHIYDILSTIGIMKYEGTKNMDKRDI